MPFYSGKDLFYRKNRNITTKTMFPCRKQHFTSKIVLYSGKLSFYQENRKFYVENDVFQRKVLEMAFYSAKDGFYKENRNFTTKTMFPSRKQHFTSKIVLYSGKLSFYQENRKFLRRKRCFLEKKYQKCRFTVVEMVLIRKNRNLLLKRGLLVERQHFSSKIVLYSGKLSFYLVKRKF